MNKTPIDAYLSTVTKSPGSVVSSEGENLDEIKAKLSSLTGVLMHKETYYQKIIDEMVGVNKNQSNVQK